MESPFDAFRNFINTMDSVVQESAKAHGVEQLAGPQGYTVAYLLDHQDEEIFIKDIETHLNISKSVASNLIKRMEKNQFIQVLPSQTDKRFKQVVLTDLGRDKAKDIKAFHQTLQRRILKGLTQEELEVSKRVFNRIKENLEIKE